MIIPFLEPPSALREAVAGASAADGRLFCHGCGARTVAGCVDGDGAETRKRSSLKHQQLWFKQHKLEFVDFNWEKPSKKPLGRGFRMTAW